MYKWNNYAGVSLHAIGKPWHVDLLDNVCAYVL